MAQSKATKKFEKNHLKDTLKGVKRAPRSSRSNKSRQKGKLERPKTTSPQTSFMMGLRRRMGDAREKRTRRLGPWTWTSSSKEALPFSQSQQAEGNGAPNRTGSPPKAESGSDLIWMRIIMELRHLLRVKKVDPKQNRMVQMRHIRDNLMP